MSNEMHNVDFKCIITYIQRNRKEMNLTLTFLYSYDNIFWQTERCPSGLRSWS